MKVHFIAIGGSAMHNLAIALHRKGYVVTGSDDEIFEPSKGRLKSYGLLPKSEGWDESNINPQLDAVILGMHAKSDNPELLQAQKLGIKIYSYPEFLYEQSKDKTRIVIGGSHGKTTITAMILHVLKRNNVDSDYMVGAQLSGFDVMVRLTEKAPYMILEGDEYLTSPMDRRPKFHVYKPDIALLSGVAWDHINVFPTFENYVEQFKIFINLISPGGTLIYCSDDEVLQQICPAARNDISCIPYTLPKFTVENEKTIIHHNRNHYPLLVFGKHNLLNLNGARLICNQLGIEDKQFYHDIMSFSGASKRLELIAKNETINIFKDFAHSPSKLQATIKAVKEQYPGKRLVACMELHTFSSLSKEFLAHYKGSMDDADEAIVYFNPHAIRLKNLSQINETQIRTGFSNKKLGVCSDSKLLYEHLVSSEWKNSNLLMMSSGNFDGMNLTELAERILKISYGFNI
jgi:UDP-N-acetylmuramate: L-alanyl-gamma-D-glutamyl-meso-diaminopimelate ligase